MKYTKLSVVSRRHLFHTEHQLIGLTPSIRDFLKDYSNKSGKSISLIIEILVRSLMMNKPIEDMVDSDLLKPREEDVEIV